MAAFLIVGVWIGGNYSVQQNRDRSKLGQFFQYLEREYVDTLDIEDLTEQAIDGILSSLDPHSAYISLERSEEMEERMNGGFTGIGVEFTIHNDTLVFVHVMENGPAASYGIQNGDRILTIDGDSVIGPGLTNSEVTKRIKGPRKSYVDLGIERDGLNIAASVQRDLIPIESVFYLPVSQGIGYVKVDRFAETTHDEFVAALNALDEQGMRSLIIDLRENPGGFLHEAVAMADEFLADDKNIVSTRYRDGRESVSKAQTGEDFESLPVHILINESSASASEVFTGALQDHDRATVYGATSFGKGLVQEDKVLNDGSKVRLTVAYYFTPSGRSIQKPYKEDGVANVGVFLSDTGRVLSSNGGIDPDVPLQNDSASYFWTFSFGTIDAFAFTHVDGERATFNDMSFQQFVKDFTIDANLMSEFLAYGGYGIAFEDLSITDKEELALLLKAALAKNYWGFDAYRKVLLKRDTILEEVYAQAQASLE